MMMDITSLGHYKYLVFHFKLLLSLYEQPNCVYQLSVEKNENSLVMHSIPPTRNVKVFYVCFRGNINTSI